MESLLKGYVRYQQVEGIDQERTLNKYMMCINEFIEEMNIKTINDIEKLRWGTIRTEYIMKKKNEGLSNSSLNLRITSLRSFFGWLEGVGMLEKNVAKNIKKFKTKAREVKVDKDEIIKLLDQFNTEHDKQNTYLTARNRLIAYMLIGIGLRNEEIRDIRINDIEFKSGRFVIVGKFSKSRELFIPEYLMNMYRDYFNYRNLVDTESDYMFVSKTGKQLDKNIVNEIIKNACDYAELDDKLVAHAMRHICGSLLLEEGNTIEEVSKILGHSNVQITSKIYAEMVVGSSKRVISNNSFLREII